MTFAIGLQFVPCSLGIMLVLMLSDAYLSYQLILGTRIRRTPIGTYLPYLNYYTSPQNVLTINWRNYQYERQT
jgi:hypothetical protein